MLKDLSISKEGENVWKEVVNNYLRIQLPNEYKWMSWTGNAFYNFLEYENQPRTKDSFQEIENKLMSGKSKGEKLNFNLRPIFTLEKAKYPNKLEMQYNNINHSVKTLLKIDLSNKENFIPFKGYYELRQDLNAIYSIDVMHNAYPNNVKKDVATWNKHVFNGKNIPEWATLTKIFLTKLVTSVSEEYHSYY